MYVSFNLFPFSFLLNFFPKGDIIATADIVGCVPYPSIDDFEGDYEDHLIPPVLDWWHDRCYGWQLSDVRKLAAYSI